VRHLPRASHAGEWLLGVAELALLEMADGDQLDEYRALFEQARQRLMSAIDGALRLAELQGGDATIKIIPVDLGAIIATAGDRLREEWSKPEFIFSLTAGKTRDRSR